MKTEPQITKSYKVISLLNNLLDFKLNSNEFISNEKIITKISEVVDRLDKSEFGKGHALLSITRGKIRNLILLIKDGNWYSTIKWNLTESIEKVVDVEIHEENLESNLSEECEKLKTKDSAYIRDEELFSALVNPSLNGFSCNKKILKEYLSMKNVSEMSGPKEKQKLLTEDPTLEPYVAFGKKILSKVTTIKKDLGSTIKQAVEKLNLTELKLDQQFTKFQTDKIVVGEIVDVKEIGGKRQAQFKWVSMSQFKDTNFCNGKITTSCSAGIASHTVVNFNGVNIMTKRSNDSSNDPQFQPDVLESVPYNYLDRGRLFVAIKDTVYDWKIILSTDPKVDPLFKTSMETDLTQYLQEKIEEGHTIEYTKINVPSMKAVINYSGYEANQRRLNPDLTGTRLKLKSLKVMVDEHNYLIKKNESVGQDVTVTDNIKFNHKEGKIAYNDFSIAIPDEYVKAKLYTDFNEYLMKFYRAELTEQDILDNLIKHVFEAVAARLNASTKVDLELPIKINENINITITGKLSKRYAKDKEGNKTENVASTGQLFYINDQRFNKNEVLMILKEMTCYRSQKEADAFIENIGRLGLASYIGITTGYEVNFATDSRGKANNENPENRLFRFRKLKGRSNYELLLDNTSIPIKGRKLVNILYENFIGERVPGFLSKIPDLIYECSGSSIQYLKYKILIDESYKAFKEKSKEFLNKKIEEFGAKSVKYVNKKSGKIMDGILVEGASGRSYVIAYDVKDSFVFMDPQLTPDTEDRYREGKYICMIDQSNIKSNISYDTIISKLMALKNDSSIAHTIYNLQEELN